MNLSAFAVFQTADIQMPDIPPPVTEAFKFLLFAVACTALSSALSACLIPSTVPASAATAKEGYDLKRELEACRKEASTCEGYVACRTRVEAEHGMAYTGRCVP